MKLGTITLSAGKKKTYANQSSSNLGIIRNRNFFLITRGNNNFHQLSRVWLCCVRLNHVCFVRMNEKRSQQVSNFLCAVYFDGWFSFCVLIHKHWHHYQYMYGYIYICVCVEINRQRFV